VNKRFEGGRWQPKREGQIRSVKPSLWGGERRGKAAVGKGHKDKPLKTSKKSRPSGLRDSIGGGRKSWGAGKGSLTAKKIQKKGGGNSAGKNQERKILSLGAS